MTKPQTAVLFDLDGTLLDTAPDLHRALNEVLRQHDRPGLPLEVVRPVASHGASGLLRLGFGENFNPASREQLRADFLTAYARDVSSRTRYFNGIEQLINELMNRNIPFAIVTNKPTRFTEALLPAFPALMQTGSVVCGDTLDVAKPDPAPLLYAAQQLRADPACCWYIGDAERDIQAGQRAGMQTVLATYGYLAEEDDIDAWQADFHIEHPCELLELLEPH